MDTKFGPEAKEGDYVIVLDHDYTHRESKNLLAKVHRGKAYTGTKTNYGYGKYIHKLSAIVVVPADIVPDTVKANIEADIQASSK